MHKLFCLPVLLMSISGNLLAAYPGQVGSIIAWKYPELKYGVDYEALRKDDVGELIWYTQAHPQPTEQDVNDWRKEYWADRKKTEIYTEQSIRSKSVLGFEMTSQLFDFFEELFTQLIKSTARNAITEADSPLWYGIAQLRNDRNTLLTGLQNWVNDPTKTADDIKSFDVSGWSGWSVPRP